MKQNDLKELASSFPSLASTFVIGASLEGRPLMGITVGARSQLRPRVRLYSGLAGDQATGRELLAHTATHLLHSYGKDRDVTNLLERVQISFLPSANPDGFPRARKGSCSGGRRREGERNAADVSLETDFPTAGQYDRFQVEEEYDPYSGRQPETVALMDWSVSEPWLLGVHLQDGAVAVTYPFHSPLEGAGDGAHNTADEKELIHLAETLVEARDDSRSKCYFRPEEELMNGAEFQAEFRGKRGGGLGSVEDFSYLFTGSLDLRLGVSCCKYPVRYSLTKEWERQRDGLLAVIQQANRGVKGVVYLPDNTPAPFTDLMVWDPEGQLRQKNGTTSVQGEYWRYLLPALRHYTLQAVLDDCQGSGLRFASPRLQVLVTEKRPLATQLVFLRHVGYCKGAVVPSKYSDLVDEFGIFHRETDFTLVNSEL